MTVSLRVRAASRKWQSLAKRRACGPLFLDFLNKTGDISLPPHEIGEPTSLFFKERLRERHPIFRATATRPKDRLGKGYSRVLYPKSDFPDSFLPHTRGGFVIAAVTKAQQHIF